MDIWLLISDSVVLLILIAFFNSIRKKETLKFSISFFIVLFTVWLLKEAFKVPRPNLEPGYAFISLHSALAFHSIYFLREYIFMWVWPLLIAISRVKLLAHRIMDVILGALYGLFIPFVIDKEWNRIKRNFLENEGEILRKFVHLTFYLTFPFLALYNMTYFYAYTIFVLTALFIINTVRGEVFDHPLLKPLKRIRRNNENSLLHTTYFPILSLILALFFNDPKLITFVGLTFAIGDSLTGLLNILIKRYLISALISSFYLFLIVSIALDLNYGVLSVISFLFADWLSKKLKINDNYTIPLFSFLFYFLV